MRIIERLLTIARELGGPALVFTFDPHPARLLHPEQAPAPLCSGDRKAKLLAALGVDAVLVYPTTLEFLRTEARAVFRPGSLRPTSGELHRRGPQFLFWPQPRGDG